MCTVEEELRNAGREKTKNKLNNVKALYNAHADELDFRNKFVQNREFIDIKPKTLQKIKGEKNMSRGVSKVTDSDLREILKYSQHSNKYVRTRVWPNLSISSAYADTFVVMFRTLYAKKPLTEARKRGAVHERVIDFYNTNKGCIYTAPEAFKLCTARQNDGRTRKKLENTTSASKRDASKELCLKTSAPAILAETKTITDAYILVDAKGQGIPIHLQSPEYLRGMIDAFEMQNNPVRLFKEVRLDGFATM